VPDRTNPPWQVQATSTLHENPYFSVLQQDVVVNDQQHIDFYSIWFPRPAVGILARRGTDILLLRQYRFLVDEYVWAIPSGGVAEGESLEQAAFRELREETGMVARSLRPLMGCYASYGCSNQRFEIFLAADVEPASQAFDEAEVISVHWFTRDEVMQMVRANQIVDNLSLSPILLALIEDGLP
jgi:ADP-ribose pyrophosphatase